MLSQTSGEGKIIPILKILLFLSTPPKILTKAVCLFNKVLQLEDIIICFTFLSTETNQIFNSKAYEIIVTTIKYRKKFEEYIETRNQTEIFGKTHLMQIS